MQGNKTSWTLNIFFPVYRKYVFLTTHYAEFLRRSKYTVTNRLQPKHRRIRQDKVLDFRFSLTSCADHITGHKLVCYQTV